MTDEITLELVRKMEFLEVEQKRLASLRPLYEILNHKLLSISTTQNAWDIPNTDYLICVPTANLSINGIANGVPGRKLFIANVGFVAGSFTITLTHENAGATATDRISIKGGVSAGLTSGGAALLIYSIQDNSLYRWRVLWYQ